MTYFLFHSNNYFVNYTLRLARWQNNKAQQLDCHGMYIMVLCIGNEARKQVLSLIFTYWKKYVMAIFNNSFDITIIEWFRRIIVEEYCGRSVKYCERGLSRKVQRKHCMVLYLKISLKSSILLSNWRTQERNLVTLFFKFCMVTLRRCLLLISWY